jgi:hypothetical protein
MRYVDDSKLSGQDPFLIQQTLDLLVDLLARTGMQVNTREIKTMIVTCGAKIIARQSTPAYKRRMTGEGERHRKKKRTQGTCSMCKATMQEKYLPDHTFGTSTLAYGTTLDSEEEGKEEEKEGEADEAVVEEEEDQEEVTYTMSTEGTYSTGECPKCSIRIKDRFGMRLHFIHRHLNDKIIIEEEGELPRCPSYGMFGRHSQAPQ